jgi:hypothetical protein
LFSAALGETARRVFANIQYPAKERRDQFQIGGIGEAFVFILHSLKVHNSINEKGSYG